MNLFSKMSLVVLSVLTTSSAFAQALTSANIAGLHEAVADRGGRPFKISARFTENAVGGGFQSSLSIFPPKQAIWPLIPCSSVHTIKGAKIVMQVDCREMIDNEIRCENLAKAAKKNFKALEWSPATFKFTIEMKSLAQAVGQTSSATVKFSLVSQDVTLTKNLNSQFIAERSNSDRFKVARELGCNIQGVQSVRR